MNNTELKQLYNEIKPTKNELDEMQNACDAISNIIKNNIDGNVKVAELRIGGSFKKGTIIKGRKEVDIVVSISPKNDKKLFYKDLANLNMNSIENALYLNYYDKLQLVQTETKIIRNYDRNTLSLLNNNGVDIDFLVKFKKEHLMKSSIKSIENFYLERDEKQLNFINYANKEYSLFKNVVMIVKYLRNQHNLIDLKSYMIEIILYYSLVKYLKDNTYVGYINSFTNGLKDFIDKKTIEVSDKMYSKLGVKKTDVPDDQYKVLDVANRSNNVAKYVSNITFFVSFYNYLKNEFKNDYIDKETTKCVINYKWYDDSSYVSVVSVIGGINQYETGKIRYKYLYTSDNIIDDFYKHMLRIIRLTLKHKFSKNIVIECKKQMIDIYRDGIIKNEKANNKLNTDQLNKFNQLKQRIKKEDLKIEFIPIN